MNPAAAAPAVALTSSGPAFRKVCSLSMISEHGRGEPAVPCGEAELGGAAPSRFGSAARPRRLAVAGVARRRNANGTTISERVGAATMPSATDVLAAGDADGDEAAGRRCARPTRR